MGQPSFQASNAVIYLTYGAFLVLGTGIAWRLRKQTKNSDLLAGNRTQTALPLALNFIASEGMGPNQDQRNKACRDIGGQIHRWRPMQEMGHLKSGGSSLLSIPRKGRSPPPAKMRRRISRQGQVFHAGYTVTTGTSHDFERLLFVSTVTSRETEAVEDLYRPSRHSGCPPFCSLEHDMQRPRCCPGHSPPNYPDIVKYQVALGSGILFSYPQLAVISGLQGVLVYALSSALPLFVFAALGPAIRRKCPDGFVLTEWTRQRYGLPAAIFLGFLTLATLFLYMVAELSAIGQVVTALTGLDGLPVVIVEVVVTTIYTAVGGFRISFLTDNVQGALVLGLIVIASITVGAKTHISHQDVIDSGLLEANLLGWQLLYILPVAILTNDFFLSNFWLRTFASRTDKDLWIGVSLAAFAILIILTLVGVGGLVAVWSGAYPGEGVDPADADSSVAFFLLLAELPSWVVGIVLVMSVSLSTAAFDSLQSAMVSSASNDIFRNRLGPMYIRAGVVLIIVPVVVLALKTPSILQIYLISDLVSASTIPVLIFGLWDRFSLWNGTDVIIGGLGGLLTVFIFGTIYYGDALTGAQLLLLEQGLYEGDWGAFGAFVAAPIGGILFGCGSFVLRMAFEFVRARTQGRPFQPINPRAHEIGAHASSSDLGADAGNTVTTVPAGTYTGASGPSIDAYEETSGRKGPNDF